MSFALQVSAAAYVGNGSTSTPYPVTFPVVSSAHIMVSVQVPTGSTAVQLSAGQYTVHDLGEGTYNVTTATAYANTATVTVFRSIPFDQPFEFPEGGALRTTEIERSFDRVVMQIHQLWRSVTGGEGGTILPGTGTAVQSVATWANAAARALKVPSYAGQVGVQLDNYTVWIGRSTTAGDWAAYQIPAEPDVWGPMFPYYGESVPTALDRWVATVPRNFEATHLRISTGYSSGVTCAFTMKIGNDAIVLATEVLSLSEGPKSVLLPFAEWTSGLPSGLLPAGAQITIDTEVSGTYPAVMAGMQIDFLGRWVA